MKKNHQNNNLLNYLTFLLLAIIITGFIYGGLTINKLYKTNLALETKQTTLENKIISLENKVIDNQNQLVVLNDKLDQNDKKLAFYRKQTLDAQAQLAQIKTEPIVAQPVNTIQTAIKTVTKRVYVEKPKYETTLTIEGIGSYKIAVASGDTAFSILKKASVQYGLEIDYDTFSFGVFVKEIAGLKPVGNQYWAFYYNGKYSQVGASDQKITAGDTIYWRLESF